MFGFVGKLLDKLKAAAAVKFIAPLIKTVAPYITLACTAIGVDPELAKEFTENTVAVATTGAIFAIDLALTALRAKRS